MESFINSKIYGNLKVALLSIITSSECVSNILNSYKKWENEKGNIELSYLNKSIKIFLIAKSMYPEILWDTKQDLIDLVLQGCKNVGEIITIKEFNKIIQVEIIDRKIRFDNGIDFFFKRKDGSVFSNSFYD